MKLKFVKNALDFLLPRFCFSCEVKLQEEENIICKNCFEAIEIARPDFIKYEYKRKFESSKIISDFHSKFVFEKDEVLQELIHALKYSKRYQIGIYLGEILGKDILQNKSDWHIDEIIPIPLHRLKKAERGFNQSYYIAKGIEKVLQRKVNSKLVKRKKYTETQTSKNLEDRKANIKMAFEIMPNASVKEKNFLLIDDVITTGSTVLECAEILRTSGAANIYAASVAIAEF